MNSKEQVTEFQMEWVGSEIGVRMVGSMQFWRDLLKEAAEKGMTCELYRRMKQATEKMEKTNE